MFKTILASIISIFFLILTVGIGSSNQIDDDLNVVRDRLSSEIMDSLSKSVTDEVKNVPSWMNESTLNDGKWSDIDYNTQSSVAWGPAEHLGRVRILAAFYKTKNQSYYSDPKVLGVILKSLDYFVKNNFTNYNWWFNEVGVPISIGQTLILLQDDLGSQYGSKLLDYSKFFMHREMSVRSTGQNFAWLAQIRIYRGVIERDPSAINEAVRAMENEIRTKQSLGYNKEEGIFPDYSFIQHQWVFYNLGYGMYFSQTLSQFVSYLMDTPFQLSKESIHALIDFVVKGQLTMIRNGSFDYSGMGRNHVRIGVQDASPFAAVCKRLIPLNSVYTEVLEKCAKGIPVKDFKQNLNQLFWNGDYMVHHRDAFMISVKMHSLNLANTDQPSNGEGLQSEHLSDGATYLMQSGDEYTDIFPVWDNRKIPGTTTVPLPWPKIEGILNFDYRSIFSWSANPNKYVGGVSDGKYGLATMVMSKKGIHEKKTYFFNDFGMIVLGSELRCDGNCEGLASTINQEWLSGKVTVGKNNGNPHEVEGESSVLEKARWVHHGNTLFLFPRELKASVSNLTRSGDISLISAQVPSKIFSGKIFSLALPREGKLKSSYSYAVMPGLPLEKVLERVGNPHFTILSNTESIQAVVSDENLIQASFFERGALDVQSHLGISEIKVDQPMALQVTGAGELFEVFVSDPTKSLLSAKVTLSFENGNVAYGKAIFPAQGNAGKPVRVLF